jgi:hypothetical protein
MTQADSVHSTPPTSTPIIQQRTAAVPTRRRFLTVAAGARAAKPTRDQIAAIIDPQAMALAHKLGRPDLTLTAEMQERIRAARAAAAQILARFEEVQS